MVGILEVPPEGTISMCYMDGKLCHCLPQEGCLADFTRVAFRYPDVNVSREVQRNRAVCEDYQDVFRHVESSLLQKLVRIWCEHGFVAALDYAASPRGFAASSWMHTLAHWALSITAVFGGTYCTEEMETRIASQVAQTRDWERSNVRAMAWSTFHHGLAVAAYDDSVRVFSQLCLAKDPVLKWKGQRNVTCIAWRPSAEPKIAVASSGGVILWDVAPRVLASRSVRVFAHPRHTPVTAVAWSSAGDLLLSASALEPLIYVWDADNERCVPLKQVFAGGTSLLSWSPSYGRVLTPTMGPVFRVWDTSIWESERWSVPSGRVRTACWGAKGDILLFATTEEPCLYALMFMNEHSPLQLEMAEPLVAARRILDLTPGELPTGERIGGLVSCLAWDPSSRYLAVVFNCIDMVMVYQTDLTRGVKFRAICIVRGPAGQFPSIVTFKPVFTGGAMLTIAWSSGQVQYFPIMDDPED